MTSQVLGRLTSLQTMNMHASQERKILKLPCYQSREMTLPPIHNWRHLQQIKNDICGEESEALELYPAMSRIVDTVNQGRLT
jgi:hypothetical protein